MFWTISAQQGAEDPFRAFSHTASAAGTEAAAGEIAPLFEAGDILLLEGDLGAGKTCFTRGLARALDVHGEVASPTFTYLREHRPGYPGGLGLCHFDAYRLNSAEDWEDLGFDEVLDTARERSCLVVIEWPERVAEVLPRLSFRLRLENPGHDEQRFLSLEYPLPLDESRLTRLPAWQAAAQRG